MFSSYYYQSVRDILGKEGDIIGPSRMHSPKWMQSVLKRDRLDNEKPSPSLPDEKQSVLPDRIFSSEAAPLILYPCTLGKDRERRTHTHALLRHSRASASVLRQCLHLSK